MPYAGGQVVAYDGKGEKVPFKASSVVNVGPDSDSSCDGRLRRGDCVEYRIEVRKWMQAVRRNYRSFERTQVKAWQFIVGTQTGGG